MSTSSESLIERKVHAKFALVFMSVLTQTSLGAFFVVLLGDVASILGFESSNWMMALLAMFPALVGLPLFLFYLGRSSLFLSAMKKIKTSWLSRELFALSLFTLLMSVVVVIYFLKLHIVLRITTEALTLAVGIFTIYAQSMKYRIEASPVWDRETTNIKFFGVAYVGVFLMGFIAVVFSMDDIAIAFIVLGMLGAFAQIFFSLEDLRVLCEESDGYQLKKIKKLYNEYFYKVKFFRFISISLGGIVLPLSVIIQVNSGSIAGASITFFISLLLVFASEISDRFLFYVTVVPLRLTQKKERI